jgi:hypothetical protein
MAEPDPDVLEGRVVRGWQKTPRGQLSTASSTPADEFAV